MGCFCLSVDSFSSRSCEKFKRRAIAFPPTILPRPERACRLRASRRILYEPQFTPSLISKRLWLAFDRALLLCLLFRGVSFGRNLGSFTLGALFAYVALKFKLLCTPGGTAARWSRFLTSRLFHNRSCFPSYSAVQQSYRIVRSIRAKRGTALYPLTYRATIISLMSTAFSCDKR